MPDKYHSDSRAQRHLNSETLSLTLCATRISSKIMDGRRFDHLQISQPIPQPFQDLLMGDAPANSEDVPTLQDVLDALDDSDCQTILREVDELMTAKELIEQCDIQKSTVYRKLDLLSEASLVRERIEIHPQGGRITRYQRDFDDVTISIEANDQFDVEISRPKRSADERLETIWSKMGDEL